MYRGLDARPDELVMCPECHHYTLRLQDYDISTSGRPTPGDVELWELLLWGWMVLVWGYIYDTITYESRKRKVEALRAEVLPSMPNSLICPRCLHVIRKK